MTCQQLIRGLHCRVSSCYYLTYPQFNIQLNTRLAVCSSSQQHICLYKACRLPQFGNSPSSTPFVIATDVFVVCHGGRNQDWLCLHTHLSVLQVRGMRGGHMISSYGPSVSAMLPPASHAFVGILKQTSWYNIMAPSVPAPS